VGEDLDASSASIIEAVRLSESLARVWRGRPLPGLPELNEATQTVFLFSATVLPLRLIAEKLIVSDRLGEVPEETPAVPARPGSRPGNRNGWRFPRPKLSRSKWTSICANLTISIAADLLQPV